MFTAQCGKYSIKWGKIGSQKSLADLLYQCGLFVLGLRKMDLTGMNICWAQVTKMWHKRQLNRISMTEAMKGKKTHNVWEYKENRKIKHMQQISLNREEICGGASLGQPKL